MATRRSNGEGGLSWNEKRQRWIGRASIGYAPSGKRRIATVSGRTKTETLLRLRRVVRDHQDGLVVARRRFTVGEATEAWLTHGLAGRSPATVANRRILAQTHLMPALGRRQVADLTASEIDGWLAGCATRLSTDTVRRLLSILRASIRRAQARDLVSRNVALLCDPPRGRAGRPSKALNLEQAVRLISAAEQDATMRAYIVLSLLTGARTEELRALTWAHVDLEGDPDANPPVPPSIALWRSVRLSGDTKTRSSRRTLELPARCVDALRDHQRTQRAARARAGAAWVDNGLVFSTRLGSRVDAANVRRSFRRVVGRAGLDPDEWSPRELRHSFVSLMSSSGVPIEHIAHLVGHASSRVTETVYRKELRPMLSRGAATMDSLFPSTSPDVGKQIGKQERTEPATCSPDDGGEGR